MSMTELYTNENLISKIRLFRLAVVRDHSLRSPLADRIQCVPLTPHILRIRLVGMVERTVTIPSLIGVIV